MSEQETPRRAQRPDPHPHDARAAPASGPVGGEPATPWRRLLGFLVDYLLISVYLGLLTAISFIIQAAGPVAFPPATGLDPRLTGHAVQLLTLTLPVLLYFALAEAARRQATLGKQAVGVKVVTQDGGRPTLRRSLARSAVKFLPWELAHAALWVGEGVPFTASLVLTPLSWGLLATANLLAIGYLVSLFVGTRRTPYDRLAGTVVVRSR
jgi:uncharacterized RDD family membrane protein YckC